MTSTLTLRYFDSARRGPIDEREAQGVLLDGGAFVFWPTRQRAIPAGAAFAEVWAGDRKVFGGACVPSEHLFDPVPDGMTEAEVDAYVTEAFRVATERMERRLRELVDRRLRGDD